MLRKTGHVAGILLAGTVAAAAQGTCPSGIAHDGVWVDFPDRSVFTRVLSDGRISEMEFGHDGTYLNLYTTNSVGLVQESWSIVNGYAPPTEVERLTYAGTPDPAPVPGARFDGIQTSVFGGGPPVRSSVNLVVGQARPVVIGGCSYTGLPIDVLSVDMADGASQRDSMMHLSELGLTIYLGFAEGNEPAPDTLPLSISTEPPAEGGAAPSGVLPPPLPGTPAPAPTK